MNSFEQKILSKVGGIDNDLNVISPRPKKVTDKFSDSMKKKKRKYTNGDSEIETPNKNKSSPDCTSKLNGNYTNDISLGENLCSNNNENENKKKEKRKSLNGLKLNDMFNIPNVDDSGKESKKKSKKRKSTDETSVNEDKDELNTVEKDKSLLCENLNSTKDGGEKKSKKKSKKGKSTDETTVNEDKDELNAVEKDKSQLCENLNSTKDDGEKKSKKKSKKKQHLDETMEENKLNLSKGDNEEAAEIGLKDQNKVVKVASNMGEKNMAHKENKKSKKVEIAEESKIVDNVDEPVKKKPKREKVKPDKTKTGKEGEKTESIRSVKRRKKQVKEQIIKDEKEAEHINNALNYLDSFINDRSNWKFHTCNQVYLVNKCLNVDLMPDSNFSDVLIYFTSMKGQIIKSVDTLANTAVTQYEEWQTKKKESDKTDIELQEEEPTLKFITDKVFERAQQILKILPVYNK